MMITTQPPRCQTLTDLHAYLKLLCLWPQVFFITQPPTPSQTKNDLNINFKKIYIIVIISNMGIITLKSSCLWTQLCDCED